MSPLGPAHPLFIIYRRCLHHCAGANLVLSQESETRTAEKLFCNCCRKPCKPVCDVNLDTETKNLVKERQAGSKAMWVSSEWIGSNYSQCDMGNVLGGGGSEKINLRPSIISDASKVAAANIVPHPARQHRFCLAWWV